MARTRKTADVGPDGIDRDLDDLPAPARWREWMARVEAVIFASSTPVSREQLARVVGKACPLELIIDDIREELRGRPYELISVAGGWSFRTKAGFGDAIRAALGGARTSALSKADAVVLMGVGYFQPITRGELSQLLGREVSRDVIAALRGEGLIARRAAQPNARCALRLCHHAGVFGEIRLQKPARSPQHREARGSGAHRSGRGRRDLRRRAGERTADFAWVARRR